MSGERIRLVNPTAITDEADAVSKHFRRQCVTIQSVETSDKIPVMDMTKKSAARKNG